LISVAIIGGKPGGWSLYEVVYRRCSVFFDAVVKDVSPLFD
jgi:hypothetical protein